MRATRALLVGDGYSRAIGVFGRRGIGRIQLDQNVAPDTMHERECAAIFETVGENQRLVDTPERDGWP